jgi:hypothetical protein
MCLISGGNWNNGSKAGVWTLNLNNNRTNSNNNIGFRAADYDPPSDSERKQWSHRDVASCAGNARRNRTASTFLVAKANVRSAHP